MLLPSLRKNVKTNIRKNKSLQDLLGPTGDSVRVISIEPYPGQVHNTKLVVEIDDKQRVVLYNRLNLESLLLNVEAVGSTTAAVIKDLNLKGFDFTEDDIELVNGNIVVKPMSLGYIGTLEVVDNCLSYININPSMDYDNGVSNVLDTQSMFALVNGKFAADDGGPAIEDAAGFIDTPFEQFGVYRDSWYANYEEAFTPPTKIVNYSNIPITEQFLFAYDPESVDYAGGNFKDLLDRVFIGSFQENSTVKVTSCTAEQLASKFPRIDFIMNDAEDPEDPNFDRSWWVDSDGSYVVLEFEVCPSSECSSSSIRLSPWNSPKTTRLPPIPGKSYVVTFKLEKPDGAVQETITIPPLSNSNEDGYSFDWGWFIKDWLNEKGVYATTPGSGGLTTFTVNQDSVWGNKAWPGDTIISNVFSILPTVETTNTIDAFKIMINSFRDTQYSGVALTNDYLDQMYAIGVSVRSCCTADVPGS